VLASPSMADEIPDYETYDYEREWRSRGIQNRAERELLEKLIEPRESCLELGGGFGRLTSTLESMFEKVFMIDMSRSNLERASTRLEKTKLIRTNIIGIPFEDCTFDSVVMVRVLHHVRDLKTLLGEVVRVSRRNACVVVGVPNTSRSRGLAKNTFVGVGPQGHTIYAAPISAYAHPLLDRVEMRGLGLFDNGIGKRLHSWSRLAALDVATSVAWTAKPYLFIKFRATKTGVNREPYVLCTCGAPLMSDTCPVCGRSAAGIVDLTRPVG